MLIEWVDKGIDALTQLAPAGSFWSFNFNLYAVFALLLVSLCCGAVGSLVVGSRMAFFSDALAHCAFAGVSVGFAVFELFLRGNRPESEFWEWVTPVMAGFGALVGFGIAYVRTQTGLASDTVIGVFFAGAIGLAAMLQNLMRSRTLFSLEEFLFGNPLRVDPLGLLTLAGLTVFTAGLLCWLYNYLLLAGFNNSLALSRRVPVNWCNYLFVMLLALIVNLCLRFVGVLLINALLIVPAATAANVSRNMRQLYWGTIVLCLLVTGSGLFISWEVETRHGIPLGISGTVVLLSVLLFMLSMLLRPFLQRRKPAAARR